MAAVQALQQEAGLVPNCGVRHRRLRGGVEGMSAVSFGVQCNVVEVPEVGFTRVCKLSIAITQRLTATRTRRNRGSVLPLLIWCGR